MIFRCHFLCALVLVVHLMIRMYYYISYLKERKKIKIKIRTYKIFLLRHLRSSDGSLINTLCMAAITCVFMVAPNLAIISVETVANAVSITLFRLSVRD